MDFKQFQFSIHVYHLSPSYPAQFLAPIVSVQEKIWSSRRLFRSLDFVNGLIFVLVIAVHLN